MRVRRHAGSSPMPMDGSHSFMLSRVLVYMDRFLEKRSSLDFEILEALHWLVGPEIVEEELLCLVTMLDAGDRRPRFDADLRDEIRYARDFANFMDQALRKTRKDEQACVLALFKELIKKKLDRLQSRGTSDLENNLHVFQEMFGLSSLETELCLFFVVVSIYEEAQSFFEYHLKCDRYAGRSHLAAILNSTPSEVSSSLNGTLSRTGILELSRGSVSLEHEFIRFLLESCEAGINTEFFKKIDPDVLPLDLHSVEPEEIRHVLKLLSPANEKGSTVLLYGNPGVGKTTLAYGLGKELGLDIYLCKHEGKNRAWERQAAVMAGVSMASHNSRSLLIVDDCDSLLGTRHLWSAFGAYNDKKWLHEVLESNAKVIFIVNDVRFLEESVIRRFSFSIHFQPFNRTQRIQLWKNILQDQGVGRYLTDAQVSDLAKYDVSPGIIEQAVKNAAGIGSNDRAEIHKAIVFSLEAHDSLVNGGHKPIRAGKIDPESFTLDGLNVSGANLGALMKELESFNDYLKHSGADEAVSMSLLFHGVSGAGKSYLARIIAHRLDRELISKRASDLLSPWVGGTEHNVRAAFDECAEKESVLLVDEADFLLGNRDGAVRSWEKSQVNEVLTAMELFRGVQIYTSNRFSDLDPATLRRFNHKIEFHCLDPDGVVIFYKKILQPLVGSDLERTIEKELKNISGLTPGDFKVVMTQFRFKAPGERSHESMTAALREEAHAKEVHAGQKAIGF